jgi:hypothetical protein
VHNPGREVNPGQDYRYQSNPQHHGKRKERKRKGFNSEGKAMTFLTALFPYKGPLHEREMRALDDVRDVYGIRIVSIDERKQRILVEYDASRLLQSDILFLLRNAGLGVQNDAGKAA